MSGKYININYRKSGIFIAQILVCKKSMYLIFVDDLLSTNFNVPKMMGIIELVDSISRDERDVP